MRVTIVAVVEVDGEQSAGWLHERTHQALEHAGASPIFIAACAGAFGPAIAVADQMAGATNHECAFCAAPIPASAHIPHSTAELPTEAP